MAWTTQDRVGSREDIHLDPVACGPLHPAVDYAFVSLEEALTMYWPMAKRVKRWAWSSSSQRTQLAGERTCVVASTAVSGGPVCCRLKIVSIEQYPNGQDTPHSQ